MKLLLVEDEPWLRDTIRDYLEGQGYVVTTADSFRDGAKKAHDYDYDCLVIDLMLPDGNGLDLVRQVRHQHTLSGAAASPNPSSGVSIPGISMPMPGVIIVTAKDALNDKLAGLDAGSDDYLTKPFHLSELNARLRSVLRRRLFLGNTEIVLGVLKIQPEQQRVEVEGPGPGGASHERQVVTLTGKEYELLLFMATNVNRLLSKAALAEHIWGDATDMADSHEFIYSHVKNLRRKLLAAGCPDYIRTRYGAGYIFSIDA
jgi:DNA-binding response OmpR family regulator